MTGGSSGSNQLIFGRYRVLSTRVIAAYGSTLRGFDVLTERPVVITRLKKGKMIQLGQNYGYTLQMMRNDAVRTTKITHPSLLEVYEQLEDDAYFYVVSEFTGNPVISEMRSISSKNDVLAVMELFEKIVGVIQYLSSRGISGCCIQQENVHVTVSGDIEIDNLFLCRFGLIDNLSNLGKKIASLAVYKNKAFSDQLQNEKLDVKLAGDILKSLLYLAGKQRGQEEPQLSASANLRADAGKSLMPKIDSLVRKLGSGTDDPEYHSITELATDLRDITSCIKAATQDGKKLLLKNPGERKIFLPGEVIFREGEESGEVAYIIEEGCIQILKTAPDGRELYLDVSRPGDIVGEMALIDAQPRMATARATEPTTVVVITLEQFKKSLDKTDPISRKLISVLTNRIRYQSGEIARLKSILGFRK